MGSFVDARPEAENHPVIVLEDTLRSAFGQELVTLQKPADRRKIAFKVETGSFRMKPGVGDTDDSLAAPTAADHIGLSSIAFTTTDGVVVMQMPSVLTIQGVGASDILTYWFLP